MQTVTWKQAQKKQRIYPIGAQKLSKWAPKIRKKIWFWAPMCPSMVLSGVPKLAKWSSG